MYTMSGLQMVIDTQVQQIPKQPIRDALLHAKRHAEEGHKCQLILQEQNKTVLTVQFNPYLTLIQTHIQILDGTTEEQDRQSLVSAYTLAKELRTWNKTSLGNLNKHLSALPRKKLPNALSFVLEANGLAIHPLGLFSRPFDDYIVVREETEEFYVGQFLYSDFIGVYFAKQSVRTRREEECLEKR